MLTKQPATSVSYTHLDVYKRQLYDYFITTSIGENGAEIEIRANFLGESNAAENTKIVIRNHEGNTVATGTFKKCDNENFAYEAVRCV